MMHQNKYETPLFVPATITRTFRAWIDLPLFWNKYTCFIYANYTKIVIDTPLFFRQVPCKGNITKNIDADNSASTSKTRYLFLFANEEYYSSKSIKLTAFGLSTVLYYVFW